MPADVNEQQAFLAFGNHLKELVQQNQLRKGMVASGASAAGLDVRATEIQMQLVDTEGYFHIQEFGRGPGKWPPFASILDWVELKLAGNIRSNIRNESLAYLIQRKIGTEGSVAFRTGKPTGVLSEIINDRNIDPFVSSLVERHTIKIRTDVLRLFETEFKLAA